MSSIIYKAVIQKQCFFSETYILVAGGEEPIVYLDDNKVFQ